MKNKAEVVIIGGGAAGTSIAYNLAKRGITDVVLLEEKYVPFGGTGRCAAQFRLQFGSVENCKLGLLSVSQFDTLGEETGYGDLEIIKHGYILTSYEQESLDIQRKNVELQKSLGIDSYILDAKQSKAVVPYLSTEGLVGGSYCTGEGHINPMKMVYAYKKGATDRGVEFCDYTKVTGIEVEGGKVKAVKTNKGTISTSCVVCAAGESSKYIGRMVGVRIPVEPAKRQILATEPVEYIKAPMIYSFKHGTFITQVPNGNFLMGSSEPNVRLGEVDFTPTWDFLERMAKLGIEQVPMFAHLRVIRQWAGQYGIAPDDSVILGKVPQVEGFHVACGCTKATMFAGAIGTLVAEEIAGLKTSLPMEWYSIERFDEGRLIKDPAIL